MAEVFDFGLQQHKIKMDGKFFENNLFAVAGDTGRRLEVQLLDSSNMVQNTTGISLRLNANVAGQATYAEATLVDATKGLYELDLPNGMLIAPGNWQFQWQIIGASGEKLHSFAFMGTIGSNLAEGAAEGLNFYLNLEVLKQMQEDFISGAFDSEVLETNITEKLTDLETQYAPKLTEVTAQLAQNVQQIKEIAVNIKSILCDDGEYVKGDGTHDDTTGIQRALDTKKNIYIPIGNYLVSDTLNYYTKQEIKGAGDGSNIISSIIGKPVMTNSEPFFNTNFESFRIQGNGEESNGIEMLNGYEHFYMKNVSIVETGGDLLHLVNVYGLSSSGLHLIGSVNTKNGIYSNGGNGNSYRDILIKTCDIGFKNIFSYSNTLDNAIIEANRGSGIYTEYLNNFNIINSYFEGNGTEITPSYDIHLSTDSSNVGSGSINIDSCYARSNYCENFLKIDTPMNGGKVQNVLVTASEKTYYYDIDLKNSGYISLDGMVYSKLNSNNQENLIRVANTQVGIENAEIKLNYMDDTTGTIVDGIVPATIVSKIVRNGNIITLSFNITIGNITSVPTGRLITISLPIKRSVYTGYFTNKIDFGGTNPNVKGLYALINNKSYITLKKDMTDTITSNRFGQAELVGLSTISGSITFY